MRAIDPFSSRILLAGSYVSEVENISTKGLKNDAVPSYQRYAHWIHSILYSRRHTLTYFSIFWYSYLLLPSDLQALLKEFGTKWMDKLLQKLFDSFYICCQQCTSVEFYYLCKFLEWLPQSKFRMSWLSQSSVPSNSVGHYLCILKWFHEIVLLSDVTTTEHTNYDICIISQSNNIVQDVSPLLIDAIFSVST